jgi:hypothetical protein
MKTGTPLIAGLDEKAEGDMTMSMTLSQLLMVFSDLAISTAVSLLSGRAPKEGTMIELSRHL